MNTIEKAALVARQAPTLWRALRQQGPAGADELHLNAAVKWLEQAQLASGCGGFAHSFHLLRGWQPAYPETTGYIIPTLHEAAGYLSKPELRDRTLSAARWLAAIHQPDGCFLDLDGRPQVFDTGQILIGLNYLAVAEPGYLDLAVLTRAARWLCQAQEPDGSFARQAYNGIAHAYYSRVGAALVAAGKILAEPRVSEAGLRNLRWVVTQKLPNGFFDRLSFDARPPFLHTMIYVIEGLLDGEAASGEPEFRAAALGFSDRLLETAGRDGILRSQYNGDFSVANPESCMTGLAQWAGVCFRLAATGADPAYRDAGLRALDYCKARQILCDDERLHGGLLGSTPLHGRYMTAAIPNWGVKFFIDAIRLKQGLKEAPIGKPAGDARP